MLNFEREINSRFSRSLEVNFNRARLSIADRRSFLLLFFSAVAKGGFQIDLARRLFGAHSVKKAPSMIILKEKIVYYSRTVVHGPICTDNLSNFAELLLWVCNFLKFSFFVKRVFF